MRTLISVLFVGMAACSGESEYASLYDAPTVPATGTIYGTWAGDLEGFDVRIVLETSRITFASKCGSRIVGADAAANISEDQIEILESAEDGDSSCFVTLMPHTSAPCSSDPFTPKDNCFEHENTGLTLYDTDVDFIVLTKLSDATP